ncbi:MAG: hypothetical protein Q8922_06030 [Bacteroidota bacterium]|nr:hypothetical protein [Bacteroidota bacterium]MDP4234109.1 hypothetical protein [Bacteroidota bacterium]MDP4243050.1 hypothetical protein [Bacteroidota bacterium]MDP4287476.1 hypothetical protein [Bacteroidota bacterium]
MAKILKHWHLWALVAVLALLGFDLTQHLFNFPIRLGALRIGLLFAEQTWTRLRV